MPRSWAARKAQLANATPISRLELLKRMCDLPFPIGRSGAQVTPLLPGSVVVPAQAWPGTVARGLARMLRKPRLIVILADIGHVHPCVAHLVDCSVAPSHPLIRIRVPLMRGR